MTVRDFETEQQYFDSKRYLINRLLHGTGIVCGFQDLKVTKKENEPLKINFVDGGMALDCCGHEIIVPSNTLDKEIVDESGNPVSSNSVHSDFYLYLKYKTSYGSYLAVASNSSSCEEKCCPGRVIEDFAVVFSYKAPSSTGIHCRTDFPLEPDKIDEAVKNWLNTLEQDNWSCPMCEEEIGKVFLASIKSKNDGTFFYDKENTKNHISAIFRNEELYQIFKCHSLDSNNPHRVTASQINALVSINNVKNPGGNIELIPNNLISIDVDNMNKRITIGETHSEKMDNPHNVTAAQVKALASIGGVDNAEGAEGKIKLIQDNSISINADNTNKCITIGETHSRRMDNPHNVTAAQVEALKSINSVFNPGGNIELVNKGSIEITPEDTYNRILIGETHSERTDNPHNVNAAQAGALVSVDGVSNPGGNIDLIEGTNIIITPDENNKSIKIGCTLGSEIQPAKTEIKSIGTENLVGTSTKYAREDHVHTLEDNFVDYSKLSAELQEQLSILSMYLRERALKCSVTSFKKVAEDFKNERAFEVSLNFKKAIGKKLYEKESDFINFMDSMQSLIKVCAEEISEQAEEGCLKDFENSLEILKNKIGEGIALKIATQQDEVCFYALELKLTVNNPMYKALNCTAVSFKKVSDLFKSEIASKISFNFEKAIDGRLYEDEDKFLKFMEENLESLKALPEEIKLTASEESLNNYISSVDTLAEAIASKEALEIAGRQQEVCSYAKNLAVSDDPIKNPMYRALKCAVGIYREVSSKLESDIADTISLEFEKAVNNRLYDNENDFIKFMEENIHLLKSLPEEIEGLAIEEELTNYITVVNELADTVKSGKALEIAAKQEELCFFAQKLDPSSAMYRALKCTAVNFVEIADLFENKTAKAISEDFGKAVDKKVYEEEEEFIKFIEENLESFEAFAKEIKELAIKETLDNYILSVEKLSDTLESREAAKIAASQEEVCSSARELKIHLIA
ncbi:hypothetical protein [Methanosarcina sp. UBA5]|uniref:hypothetical protein n=1 Tax=Methanosarcina sp. UBA5 TaxID=1915593 RepID=UPI0025FAC72C|nr:hypothetical protein [Methanosarcina sp. UBA5]